MIATAFLIVFAAICNAVMDKIAHHYHRSVFFNMNERFWNPTISWRNKYVDRDVAKGHRKVWIFKYPVALTDAWHLFKSLMLASLMGAVVCYGYANVMWAVLDFLFFGILWVITFNLFYNIIFEK